MRRTGADRSEARDLVDLAAGLGSIKTKGLSARAKRDIAAIAGSPIRTVPVKWVMAGMATVALSALTIIQLLQPARPVGTEVERSGDNSLPTEEAEYIETLVKERDEQIKQLELEKAKPEKIEEIEKKYQDKFENYWHKNYREDDRRKSYYRDRFYNLNDNFWNWQSDKKTSKDRR